MSKPTSEPVQAKHTHYVSNHNNAIHPAMTSPVGYEDEHPAEWRPATGAEIERYNKGETEATAVEVAALPVGFDSASTPSTIQLEDDAGETVTAADGTVVPAAAIPPAAPPPAPAFGGKTKK